MNIIYRKAELNDIPKLNPLLAQLSDAMADPQKMAEKMKKIAKNEDNYLLVAENTMLKPNSFTPSSTRGSAQNQLPPDSAAP